MKKNIVTAILIFIMFLMAMNIHAGQDIDSFTDLEDHWGKDFIASLVAIDVISGYPDNSFRPDNNITVAEFNVLALKGMAIEYDSAPAGEAWYMGSVNESKSRGIIDSGEFRDYNRPITRAEMARIIVRTMGESPASGSTDFTDDNTFSRQTSGYIKRASDLGIISGYPDDSFGPDRNATRAEASVMVTRMVDLGGKPPEAEQPEEPEIGEKTTELTRSDINRILSHPLIDGGASIRDFPEDLSQWERELWADRVNDEYSHLFEYTPIVHPDLVFVTLSGDRLVQGVAQKEVNGRMYEADAGFFISEAFGGHVESRIDTYFNTDWREVR